MQDIQNIPNPDVNSPETDADYGRNPNSDVEQPDDSIPLPPDEIPPPKIDEPGEIEPQSKIDEDNTDPKMIV